MKVLRGFRDPEFWIARYCIAFVRTGKKDIKAICEEHPGWNRRTVTHYYAMYENGESLQPRCGIVAPVEQAYQPALLPATVMQDTSAARNNSSVEGETWYLETPQGTGNYSTIAFKGAPRLESFETRTSQAHIHLTQHEFELLWEAGRVLQWVSKNAAYFMYLGEDEDEDKYEDGIC